MKYNPQKHHRRSIRLRGYDYAQAGAYFITICTHQKLCWFGDVREGKMCLNLLGHIVAEEWMRSSQIRGEIKLDAWVVMPNHLHGIVIITQNVGAQLGAHGCANLQPNATDFHRQPRSISSFVAGFKAAVTKRLNEIHNTPGRPIWQRNYYESIIRDENSFNNIREYIINNPLRWMDDPENPQHNDNVGAHGHAPLPDVPF